MHLWLPFKNQIFRIFDGWSFPVFPERKYSRCKISARYFSTCFSERKISEGNLHPIQWKDNKNIFYFSSSIFDLCTSMFFRQKNPVPFPSYNLCFPSSISDFYLFGRAISLLEIMVNIRVYLLPRFCGFCVCPHEIINCPQITNALSPMLPFE